jgi:hypothetical protein
MVASGQYETHSKIASFNDLVGKRGSFPRPSPAEISERLHASVLEAPLVSSHSARGATERLCHIILISQALLNQSDHRIGFAYTVS